MTLLMHGKTPVCAATTREYYPAEPLNMQYLRNADQTSCMTPRLVFENGSDNLTESGVTLMQTGACALCAQGEDWKIGYSFGEKVTITVESAHPAKFILPIIRSGEIVVGDNVLRIGKIVMRAEKFSCTPDVYGFHQVGGFIWLPIAVEVQRKCEITIEVEG